MTLLLLLGTGAGLSWGIADFFGGLQSRYLPALGVALWSQMAGAMALIAILLLFGGRPEMASVGWGLISGIFGGIGLLCFYRGLAAGVMSIVSPIAACGAVVPVLAGLAMGEIPTTITVVGMLAAFGGVILVSLQPQEATHDGADARLALILALASALGFGLFYLFLNRGSGSTPTSPLWAVGGARASSLSLLALIVVLSRRAAPWPGRRAVPVAAIGILDTVANGLFAYASTFGSLGIASVLGSLYPVATVILGRIVLSERLSLPQHAGVALALVGVALISLGS